MSDPRPEPAAPSRPRPPRSHGTVAVETAESRRRASRQAGGRLSARRRRGGLGACLVGALLLAGCGGESDPPREDPSPTDRSRTTEPVDPDASRPDRPLRWDPGALTGPAAETTVARGLPPRDSARILALYRQRDGRPLWTDDDGLTEPGRAALERLRASREEGLAPSDYGVPTLEELRHEADEDAEARRRLDVGLTSGLLRYTVHRARGRLERPPYDEGWKLDSVDAVTPPDSLTAPDRLLAWVEARRPGGRQYHLLQESLARLREIEEGGGWPAVEPGPGTESEVWEEGDSAQAVAALRARLSRSVSPEERRLARDGQDRPFHFDAELRASLEHAQRRHALSVDGVLGPATAEVLNAPASERRRQVEIALERWRWMPRDLGERALVVAVPMARLHVLEGEESAMEMKVVVGESGWETTLFQDAMDRIVVNPYWNVPRSIMREEILPKVMEDPSHLQEENMEVVEYTGEGVRVVDPGTIDWAGVDPAGFPYRLRERPGPGNALGKMKFLFPNEHAIYLHDTPADHLFQEPVRSFSHGCVRVERPMELARWLMSHASDHSMEHLREQLATGERRRVELHDPVPVYLVYLTAWANEEGVPSFGRDLYDRDAAVRDALAAAMDGDAERVATN